MIELPRRTLQQGRLPDREFEPEERLFRRVRLEDIEDGRVKDRAIDFPAFSVNRAKYSEAEDVLLPDWANWGIAVFHVGDVPLGPLPSASPHVFTFAVEHDPLPANYAHSEVRTYKNGAYSPKLEVPKTVQRLFRLLLAPKVSVLKRPAP